MQFIRVQLRNLSYVTSYIVTKLCLDL